MFEIKEYIKEHFKWDNIKNKAGFLTVTNLVYIFLTMCLTGVLEEASIHIENIHIGPYLLYFIVTCIWEIYVIFYMFSKNKKLGCWNALCIAAYPFWFMGMFRIPYMLYIFGAILCIIASVCACVVLMKKTAESNKKEKLNKFILYTKKAILVVILIIGELSITDSYLEYHTIYMDYISQKSIDNDTSDDIADMTDSKWNAMSATDRMNHLERIVHAESEHLGLMCPASLSICEYKDIFGYSEPLENLIFISQDIGNIPYKEALEGILHLNYHMYQKTLIYAFGNTKNNFYSDTLFIRELSAWKKEFELYAYPKDREYNNTLQLEISADEYAQMRMKEYCK